MRDPSKRISKDKVRDSNKGKSESQQGRLSLLVENLWLRFRIRSLQKNINEGEMERAKTELEQYRKRLAEMSEGDLEKELKRVKGDEES